MIYPAVGAYADFIGPPENRTLWPHEGVELEISGFQRQADGVWHSPYIMVGSPGSPIGELNSEQARELAGYLLAAADQYDAL
jgi:hypothetical protein